MSDDKRKTPNDYKNKRNKKGKEDDRTLKTLIALAGFAFGATSVIAWNNRKNIQDKAQTAKERAVVLKEKSVELTETVKSKIADMQEKKKAKSLEVVQSDERKEIETITGESYKGNSKKELEPPNKQDDNQHDE